MSELKKLQEQRDEALRLVEDIRIAMIEASVGGGFIASMFLTHPRINDWVPRSTDLLIEVKGIENVNMEPYA